MKKTINVVRKYLKTKLKICATFTVISNVILFVISLVNAREISDIIMGATEGKVDHVIFLSARLLLILLLLYFVNTGTSGLRQNKTEIYRYEFKYKLQERILGNKLSKINKMETGGTLENLTDDLKQAFDLYADIYPEVICAIVQIVLYAVYLAILSPVILIALTIAALLQVLPPIIVEKYMAKYYGETRELEAQVTEEMIQDYNGLAEIKRNNAVNKVMESFVKLHKKVYSVDRKNQFLLQTETAMDTFVKNALTYGTYAFLGFLAVLGTVTVDVAIQAIVLSSSFYSSSNQVFQQVPKIRISKFATVRLSKWFVEDVEKQNRAMKDEGLILSDFSYQYDDSERLLFDHLNCFFPIDQIAIIVGKNGSGKSTLIKLLSGWLTSEYGEVSFCGMNPDLWKDEEREQYIFYLPQDDPKFHVSAETFFGTFMPERMEKCFQNARLFGLNNELLHEQIANLSGGERKKIFLSVAFSTKENVFLFLDEPTNSLDAEGIMVFISLLTNRRGALLITHEPQLQALPYFTYKISDRGVITLDEKHIS